MPTLPDLLREASRTFAIGIDLLPEPLRAEIRIAYLLLRVSDYLEDNEEMAPEAKSRLLRQWEGVLGGTSAASELLPVLDAAADPTPDALVARHTREVLEGLEAIDARAREIVTDHVRESTLGMARWVERGSDFADEADLDDYMHEVAGRVGYLLTDLFAYREPATLGPKRLDMMEPAREFGLALQTVNVIRGLHTDRDRGWVYVPRSFLSDFEGDASSLFRPENREVALAALDRLVHKAERHLDIARGYVRAIPRRHRGIRLFCLLPLMFAVRTLAISRSNPEVFDAETKITRAEVRRIVGSARVLGVSNAWMEWYCDRLAVV
ncbi:MAG: squalene/phytoene synthase family protein [Gemmatimonadota bacterium]